MKYTELNTSAKMPMIGLGTWKASAGEVYQAVRWAVKLGYTHFDCADIYCNQVELGQAFHDVLAEDHIRREELFITSKLWNDAHDPADVESALRRILGDLQLPYLDLFLIHWPIAQKRGTEFPKSQDDMIPLSAQPIEKTWQAMEKTVDLGLTKAIGVANFGVRHLQNLIDRADVSPAVNQIESHPYLQQNELIDICHKNQVAVTAYSPLGTGRIENRENVTEDPVIKSIAERLGATPAQVVLAWQLQRGVCVIPKSVHENYLRENIASLSLTLDSADMEQIAGLDRNVRYTDIGRFAYGDYTVENILA